MGCYGDRMIGPALNVSTSLPTCGRLREALVAGEERLASAVPVLRHLLRPMDPAMFCDAALAQVRGMLGDLARQLLSARAEASGIRDSAQFAEQGEEALAHLLSADDALLSYVHALTLEAVLAERLQTATGLDPVVSPLVQQLITATDEAVAGLAMDLLSAQARFLQQQQRMELSPSELPDTLFLRALLAMRAHAGAEDEDASRAEDVLRDRRRERPGRIAQIEQLLGGSEADTESSLSVSRAGLPIFLTALSLASGEERSQLLLAIFARDGLRPALAMRAAGLEQQQIEMQLALLGADPFVGEDLTALSPAQSAMMLSRDPSAKG